MTIEWKDKVVLITGGTGSFGQAFAKYLLQKQQPKKLIIFSRDEMKQYEMQKELQGPDHRVRYLIGDVRDPDRLHRAFSGVNIVIHAAALKIVPSAEYNPFEVIQTNVVGAENVINMAIDNGVEKVIALSTDKAANPINLYGASKLCAEKMFVSGNSYSPAGGTKFCVVRYGNVFNSRGSVVPFFKECRKRGVVPITDPRMTRFWITLQQGVEFVIRCVERMQGGEIFIPKLPSIRIVDLAQVICPESRQKIVGMRPGEKLHETLVPSDDWANTFVFEDQFVTCPRIYPEVDTSELIKSGGLPLEPEFEGYKSDKNDRWLGVDELKEMLAQQENLQSSLTSNQKSF